MQGFHVKEFCIFCLKLLVFNGEMVIDFLHIPTSTKIIARIYKNIQQKYWIFKYLRIIEMTRCLLYCSWLINNAYSVYGSTNGVQCSLIVHGVICLVHGSTTNCLEFHQLYLGFLNYLWFHMDCTCFQKHYSWFCKLF